MTPARLATLYVVLAAGWILLSDRAVEAFVPADWAQVAATGKGWLFVAVTGALLYGLARSLVDRVVAERDAARRSAEAARSAELGVRRAVARLEGLRSLDRDILDAASVETVAQRGCAHLRRMVPAQRAAIMLNDAAAGTATLVAVDEEDPAPATAPGARFALAAAMPALELASERPHIFDDIAQLGDLAPVRAFMARGDRTALFAPLRVEGTLLGFVAIAARQPGAFTEEHVTIAEEVANQLAIAFRAASARRDVADREARLSAILDGSPNAILTVDGHGLIRYANPKAAETFGAGAGELEGRDMTSVVPEVAAADHPGHLHAWFDDPQPQFEHSINSRARRLDGRVFPAQIMIARADTPSGRFAIVTVVDLSMRERLEARLRQAERMETIGRFAGILAHDVRNYLAAVHWSADLLAASLEPDDPRLEDVELIRRAVADGVAMTRSVLDFARPADDAVGSTDVAEHLLATRPLLDRVLGDGVAYEVDVAPGLPAAGIAGAALTQVLMNLAANARDAMPAGGRFRVEVAERAVVPGEGDAALLAPGRYLRLLVSDTGIGMDEETRSHVFEAFYTTKATAGTGLGLSSVFLILRRIGGAVDVSSEPGRGSTFTIDLPVAS